MTLPKSCSPHGDLAKTLRQHPRLFGFYVHHPLRAINQAQHSPSITPSYTNKGNVSPLILEPPFSPRAFAIHQEYRDPGHQHQWESPTVGSVKSSPSPEEDWFLPIQDQNKPERSIRRSHAVRSAQRSKAGRSTLIEDLRCKPGWYDLGDLDQVLGNLDQILASCSDILRSDTRKIPGHLPRCLTEPLTDLQVYLAADASDFLRPESVTAGIDDAEAAHFKALRILRLHISPTRFHLTFSLMALITAYSTISYLSDLISSVARDARIVTPVDLLGCRLWSQDNRHDTQAKARSVLGLDTKQVSLGRSSNGIESQDSPWLSPVVIKRMAAAQQTTLMYSSKSSPSRGQHTYSPKPVPMSQPGSQGSMTPQATQNHLALALIHRARRFKRLEGDAEILVELLARKAQINAFFAKKIMKATGFLPP